MVPVMRPVLNSCAVRPPLGAEEKWSGAFQMSDSGRGLARTPTPSERRLQPQFLGGLNLPRLRPEWRPAHHRLAQPAPFTLRFRPMDPLLPILGPGERTGV